MRLIEANVRRQAVEKVILAPRRQTEPASIPAIQKGVRQRTSGSKPIRTDVAPRVALQECLHVRFGHRGESCPGKGPGRRSAGRGEGNLTVAQ
jgi:hypothetical protein